MKLILIALMMSFGSYANANLEDRIRECERYCSYDCDRLVNRLDRRITRIANNCGYNNPRPRPPVGGVVKYYQSDSCRNNLLGSTRSERDCRDFANNVRSQVWAVEIDGQCHDIVDTTAISACLAFANSSPRSVQLYQSDSCRNNLVANVNHRTNCDELARHITTRVWAIKSNGHCEDISDTNFVNACQLYKNGH